MAGGPDRNADVAALDDRRLKFLIADDHVLFRRGFKLLVSSLFSSSELVGANDANEAWERLEANNVFDIVFLDLAMPGMNGLQGIRRFVERRPAMPVVILSAHAEPGEIMKCISLGVRGYIPKSASEDVLHHAVALVLAGEIFVPALAIDQINADNIGGMTRELEGLPADNPLRRLTARQCDTLALMIEGLSNKEIARSMGLLESTIKAHVKVILKKLNAHNRTQAAVIAADLGWPRQVRTRVN